MIGQAIPLFQTGNLLTKEMLNALKEYALNFGELLFQGYADGILCGCQVTTTKSLLQLNPGIILYRKRVYLLSQPLTQEYHPTDRETFFKVRFKDEIKTQNFIYLELETVLDHQPPVLEHELEVCRFKLQEGFKLRTKYQSFEDRITTYDTVNLIHCPFASYGGQTISPEVVADFADQMMAAGKENALDQLFCMQVYQAGGRALDARVISSYLSARLQIACQPYSNLEVFEYLGQILRETQYGGARARPKSRRGYRIMLD